MPYGYGASKNYSPSRSFSPRGGGADVMPVLPPKKTYTPPPRGGGADVMPVPPPRETYVTPPRGGGADVMPIRPPPGEKGGPGYVPPPKKKRYSKGIVDTAKYKKFLKSLIGKDPLFNIYEDEELLSPSNIKHYLSDPLAMEDPKWAKKMESGSLGYTRPWGDDPNLYIRDVEKFGMQPKGPLYGAPTMEKDWLDQEHEWKEKTMGVDKFGNEYPSVPVTNRELITKDLNSPEWVDRNFALWDINKNNPYRNETITERNKRIAETIGHEARHQLLAKGSYEQNVNKALGNFPGDYDTHELLNRMSDFQAYGDTGIYDDIYGGGKFDKVGIHGNMPRHLSSPVADAFYDTSTQFTKDTIARQAGKPYEQIDPIMQEGYERAERQYDLDQYIDPILMEGFKNQFGSEYTGEAFGYYNKGGLVDLFKYGGYLG